MKDTFTLRWVRNSHISILWNGYSKNSFQISTTGNSLLLRGGAPPCRGCPVRLIPLSVCADQARPGFYFRSSPTCSPKGIAGERVLYLNLEDERLLPMTASDLHWITDVYFRRYPHLREKECFFFFDEIQNIPDGNGLSGVCWIRRRPISA